MLADPEIDVVYNPLPNHMHVRYSILAAEAGKHVLCEKPLGMDADEVRKLMAARDRSGVGMGEAFMVRTHPQWVRTMELVRSGKIGRLRSAVGHFGFMNIDPENTRNIRAYGGGALYDIGCYPIKTSRMVFGEEPVRVAATLTRDPTFDTDILTSAVLEYPSGHCVFSVSTQTLGNQSMKFFGTTGRIEIPIPFNPVSMQTSTIRVNDETEEFAPCDQYTIQGDAFSRAVLDRTAPPVPLEDSLRNMMVIDAVFRAAQSGRWEPVETSASATHA